MEQEKLREAQEALRAAEEEARKLAYERKRIEEQVKLVQEANARRMLEIETRAKRESFRKQRALLAARPPLRPPLQTRNGKEKWDIENVDKFGND